MFSKVAKKLIKWWGIFNYTEQHKLKKMLGTLTSLLHIMPHPYMIEARLTFWDRDSLVFRFNNYEMTHTLVEIVGLIRLSYIDKEMIRSRGSHTRFLHNYILKNNKQMGCLN